MTAAHAASVSQRETHNPFAAGLPALLALNSSAICAGQAIGASSGGWMIVQGGGYRSLSWFALVFVLLALVTSVWVSAHSPPRATGRFICR